MNITQFGKKAADKLATATNNGLLAAADFTLIRSLRAFFTNTVSVRDYGALGDGATNDTAAIQQAINTGKRVYFPKGIYPCVGLTQSVDGQHLYGDNAVDTYLVKNGNGVILAATGDFLHLENLGFRGESVTPSFTGDNLTLSGDHNTLVMCGSRWAYGRAVLATGAHVQIYGSGDIWQTSDATASGYDIELGISGTATLYHELHGIYTSQSAGGILTTDVGGLSIVGGQYGKLKIATGTGPAGIGVNKVVGSRIVGDVSIGNSNTVITGCAFSAVAIVFEVGTSGCRLGPDNVFGTGYTITNNGNSNNLIMRAGTTGINVQFGHDAAPLDFSVDLGNGRFEFPKVILRALGLLQGYNAATSTVAWQIGSNASDNLTLSNVTANKLFAITAAGATGVITLQVNGTNVAYLTASGLRIMSSSGPYLTAGAGTPEGAFAAPVGSMFMRTDGGAGTSLYVKETGAGNTGWVGK